MVAPSFLSYVCIVSGICLPIAHVHIYSTQAYTRVYIYSHAAVLDAAMMDEWKEEEQTGLSGQDRGGWNMKVSGSTNLISVLSAS